MRFGFCKIETYSHDMSKGSLLIIDDKTRPDYVAHRVGMFVEVCDGVTYESFNRIYDIPVQRSTDGYQIRPKVVHKNNKGYYVKEKTGISYLTDVEVMSMCAIFKFEVIGE